MIFSPTTLSVDISSTDNCYHTAQNSNNIMQAYVFHEDNSVHTVIIKL